MIAETAPTTDIAPTADDRSRWIALVVLCVGMLMIVLDVTVVNVALPSIQEDLGFSQASLAWVVNAYLIAFGGLLLLAGCDEDIALEIAERLRLATIDEQPASIGVARWNGRESAAPLVERADKALYAAKRAGRNRVVLAA